ncbi:hypothetical protein BDV98DRAFT_582806 [Pterulicium gracile]|uniref:Uncharacterized protein n=1 Tax=Pterulicium gracile TaxID=1884261 RepID=A0A5C3QNK5_9AGAR|nr:hypothetical protein BDV98DRAFT_582806 [Pterula gracilis]
MSSRDSESNILPPIHKPRNNIRSSPNYQRDSSADHLHSHSPPSDNAHDSHSSSRKRTRTEEYDKDTRLRIKEEEESSRDPGPLNTEEPSSSSNSSASSKKRRTTNLPAGSHPLTTSQLPADSANFSSAAPISPVVRGCSVRDEEQMRSSLSVKTHQKALIEQRRGSLPMLLSGGPTHHLDDRINISGKARPPSSMTGGNPSGRRPLHAPSPPPSNPRPGGSGGPPQHSLPPPSMSFTDRRAGQLGSLRKKPADIVISPRETQTPEQLALEIQSAPPIPHGGYSTHHAHGRGPSGIGGGYPGMTLPRIPSVMGPNDHSLKRVVSTHVPPTPSRLSRNVHPVQPSSPFPHGHGQPPANSQSQGHTQVNRSPPSFSVPIASSLVPPTPSFLQVSSSHHHTVNSATAGGASTAQVTGAGAGSAADKAAFLAPFETFYDALADARQLKSWLADQLQRSNALSQSLARQQERMDEVVETLVDRRMGNMKNEVKELQGRVEELESMLRSAAPTQRRSASPAVPKDYGPSGSRLVGPGAMGTTKSGPVPESSYTFPPPGEADRCSDSWERGRGRQPESDVQQEREQRRAPGTSPAPYHTSPSLRRDSRERAREGPIVGSNSVANSPRLTPGDRPALMRKASSTAARVGSTSQQHATPAAHNGAAPGEAAPEAEQAMDTR